MRGSIRHCASATILALAGALAGCAAERPKSVPPDAKSVARQSGSNPINFTAPEDGKVWVFDRSTQKMVYSGRMTRGETLEMNASRNSIRVAGQPVTDVKLRDLNEYQVWYHKQPPAPTVSTAGATAAAAPTASTDGATASTAGATAAGATAAAPPPPPSSPPATLTQIKDELTQARAQVETTTASMNTLSQSGGADVANNYDKFATEVAKMQRDVETCRARADDLKGRAQAYFDTWNRQAEVQNPDLRRSAIAQRAEAERTFATIKSEMELTKLSLDPYMKHLTDISSYLKINKSPAALATVQNAVAAAAGDGTEVGKHVDAVLAGIDKVMAASGEATPAAAPAAAPAAK